MPFKSNLSFANTLYNVFGARLELLLPNGFKTAKQKLGKFDED